MVGLTLMIAWIVDVIGIIKFQFNRLYIDYDNKKIALFFTIFFNLLFIQAFTSAPVFVSISLAIGALNYKTLYESESLKSS